jgi:NAD(P)-dependent dehydrogenase (short-subunit alcohol dehydrogenase family)
VAAVLVTGSNKGIGLATTLALARAGHRVFATMRNPERGGELRDAIAKENLTVEIHAMDVDSEVSVSAAMAEIRARAGFVDVLVNNAGVGFMGSVEELDLKYVRATMETNYLGTLRCIRALLPEMRRQRKGCIVNVTSVFGRMAVAPFASYAAAKFALEAMSECLAQEVKPFNIRVAIVEPGVIDTAMARSVTQAASRSFYPHFKRYVGFFAASLKTPAPPASVGDTIRGIVEGKSRQFRYPVLGDALLDWRNSMTDEQWIETGALDDEAWYRHVQERFGFDARMK